MNEIISLNDQDTDFLEALDLLQEQDCVSIPYPDDFTHESTATAYVSSDDSVDG